MLAVSPSQLVDCLAEGTRSDPRCVCTSSRRERPSAATGRRRGGLWGPRGSVSRGKVGLGLRRPVGRQRCWGGVQTAGVRVCAPGIILCFYYLHSMSGDNFHLGINKQSMHLKQQGVWTRDLLEIFQNLTGIRRMVVHWITLNNWNATYCSCRIFTKKEM